MQESVWEYPQALRIRIRGPEGPAPKRLVAAGAARQSEGRLDPWHVGARSVLYGVQCPLALPQNRVPSVPIGIPIFSSNDGRIKIASRA